MAKDLNCTFVIGRIASDPEFKVTQNGKELLKFRIANNPPYSDDANFFDVSVWGKTASAIKDYMVKGKQIAIQGHLQQQRWTAADGQHRSRVEIVADSVQFLGSNKAKDNEHSVDPVNPTKEEIDTAAAKLDVGPDNSEIPF